MDVNPYMTEQAVPAILRHNVDLMPTSSIIRSALCQRLQCLKAWTRA